MWHPLGPFVIKNGMIIVDERECEALSDVDVEFELAGHLPRTHFSMKSFGTRPKPDWAKLSIATNLSTTTATTLLPHP